MACFINAISSDQLCARRRPPLSTKGRYAVRAMLDIALHGDEGPVLIKDISEREEISKLYLKQLLVPLKVAGLVRAVRGANGGFTLVRPPAQIRLIDITSILLFNISF